MNVLDGTTRSDLRVLLKDWTVAAERMTRGQLVGDDTDLDDPPLDTGEAIGSPVGGLTITIGYGPSLFDERFGLTPTQAGPPQRPAGTAERESGSGLRGR